MGGIARPTRPRLWIIFFFFFFSVMYRVQIQRKIKYAYDFALSSTPFTAQRNAPPDYTALREWVRRLPQHNPDLPYPEGRSGRYVLFHNSRVHQAGWNNKLNDMLFNTWLAHASGRAYVFHDFIWERVHYPWRIADNISRPTTPLNALIAGPSAGAPWDHSDPAPRSVSEEYFDLVCPKNERRIINTRQVKLALKDADGAEILETWRALLATAPERCIEVQAPPSSEDPFPETFDIWFWSGPRSMSLWNLFKESPVSRLLRTSPIVASAVEANKALFSLGRGRAHDPFARVLAIHVRRGDFKEACLEHAAMNDTFYNWNLLPFLPDKFDPPPAPPGVSIQAGRNTPENEELFLERCLPSPDAIAAKVRTARQEYQESGGESRNLGVLYIMSNDGTPWLDALKHTLRRDGWRYIITSRDLHLTAEQTEVSVAVDMDIGRQSAVFIGNGWSSFTSNVVHRRLVEGKEPISIRFW